MTQPRRPPVLVTGGRRRLGGRDGALKLRSGSTPGARTTLQERRRARGGVVHGAPSSAVHRRPARWSGPLRPQTVPHGHRHTCSRRSARVNRSPDGLVTVLAKSTRPQLGTQLGTDSHGCSYGGGDSVTSVPRPASVQVNAVRGRSVPPHSVDNPGGGAPSRPVD